MQRVGAACEKQGGGSMIIRQAFLHAVECGQQEWTANQLELIALGEMEFSRLGLCSEDLW